MKQIAVSYRQALLEVNNWSLSTQGSMSPPLVHLTQLWGLCRKYATVRGVIDFCMLVTEWNLMFADW